MADERNFAVHTFLMLSVYMCSAALSTAIVSRYVDVTVLMFNFILIGLNAACSATYPLQLRIIHAPFYTYFMYAVIFSKSTPYPPTHNESNLHFKHSRQLPSFFISR